MSKVKTLKPIKKHFRFIGKTLLVLIALFLVLVGLSALPAVQTSVAQSITNKLNDRFHTNIQIDKFQLTYSGQIALSGIHIKDYKQDTLIDVKTLNMGVRSFSALAAGVFNLGNLRFETPFLNLKTYKGDTLSNLDIFIKKFEANAPPENAQPFQLKANNLFVNNGSVRVSDENNPNSKSLAFEAISLMASKFKIDGEHVWVRFKDFNTQINQFCKIEQFTSDFHYSPYDMTALNMQLNTMQSDIHGDLTLKYPRGGLRNFANQVQIDFKIKPSEIALLELKQFYNGFADDGALKTTGIISGTLNDLSFNDFVLENENISLNTTLAATQLTDHATPWTLQTSNFQITSTSLGLQALLPQAFGTLLPSSLKKLGAFDVDGNLNINPQKLQTKLNAKTKLGALNLNLKLSNLKDIDRASYTGNVSTSAFHLGSILGVPELEQVAFDLEVDGQGLTLNEVNSKVEGVIRKLNFRNYNYQNIALSGQLQDKLFDGKISVDDPHLGLDFIGKVDLKSQRRVFDFESSITKADLTTLGFSERENAQFVGRFSAQLEGETLQDLIGDLQIKQASFRADNQTFVFDDFSAQSRLQEGVRVLSINSSDVISGILIGKFNWQQIPILVSNSIGGLFERYQPVNVQQGQYFNFNFNLKGKIAQALFPELSVNDNTFVQGKVDADSKLFRVRFRAPSIQYKNTSFSSVDFQMNTKNPLYNAYLETESVASSVLRANELSLINTVVNDTLFFKAQFLDQSTRNNHEINFYHTIDVDNNWVVGMQPSSFVVKSRTWEIDDLGTEYNKLIFNPINSTFDLKEVRLRSGLEKLQIQALHKKGDKQFLRINFDDVQLANILPDTPNLVLDGLINGKIELSKNEEKYEADTNLNIDKLVLNNEPIGTADVAVTATSALEPFVLDAKIIDNNKTKLSLGGTFGLESVAPINLNLKLFDFPLAPLTATGTDIISDYKGFLSGDVLMDGNFKNPKLNGELLLKDGGMSVPYLAVHYNFENLAQIQVRENEFFIHNIALADKNFNSKGTLFGRVKHQNFKDWQFDLGIQTDRLLVLNTKKTPTSLYYGNAFLEGEARIHGPAKSLTIDVSGQTAQGTSISIPVSDATTLEQASYIQFVNKSRRTFKENFSITKPALSGLLLNFDLDVTRDANLEIVVDQETGSTLKGRGAGNILMEINTNGAFNMWGDFIAYEGQYLFKNLGIFEKEFALKEGGTIVWEGKPLSAQLNMQAVYDVPGGANPALLLENDSYNKKIPTEVTINLTGNLLKLDNPQFSIDFPNTRGALLSELEYRLQDAERRQLQAVYLLVQGGFVNDFSISSQTVVNNLFQKASGVFENIFAGEDEKMNVGINLVQGDRNAASTLRTRDRLGLTLNTRISDRILVNGKFGVPVNGVEETVVVGDVQIEFLLNKDGSLRARVFNKENEFQYLGDELGYTQGVGMVFQVDFDSFKSLIKKIITTKPKATKSGSVNSKLPEFISLKTSQKSNSK